MRPARLAWQRGGAGDRQREHEQPRDDRRDQPRLRVVAAGAEREDGRAGEQQARGDRGHCAAHGAPGYSDRRDALERDGCADRGAALGGRGDGRGGDLRRRTPAARRRNGVNRAWQLYPGFDDRFWDVSTSCPLVARSEPRPGVTAPYFTGAGFHIKAPAGATLDRLVIWRQRLPLRQHGPRRERLGGRRLPRRQHRDRRPAVRRDVQHPAGPAALRVRRGGMMAPARASSATSRRTRSSTRSRASTGRAAGPRTQRASRSPRSSIAGSIVTVRDDAPPAVVARGPLTEPGWHTDDAPLSFGASDPVGIRQLRVLVDGAQVREVVAGLRLHARRAVRPGARAGAAARASVPDGTHTLSRSRRPTRRGNVARVDRTVTVDRNPPALAFVPATGRRRIVVAAPDAGSGTTGGTIEVRRRGAVPGAADAAARRAGSSRGCGAGRGAGGRSGRARSTRSGTARSPSARRCGCARASGRGCGRRRAAA